MVKLNLKKLQFKDREINQMIQEIVLDAENRDINQSKIRSLQFRLHDKPPKPYKKKTEYTLM